MATLIIHARRRRMFHWLRRLFAGRAAQESVAPEWAVNLVDAVQRAARAQARLGAQLNVVESKLEGGFSDLRSTIASAAPPPSAGGTLPWPELFDAADVLEDATLHLAEHGEQELAAGVRGAVGRLESFLAGAGFVRVANAGNGIDAKLFRVIATTADGDDLEPPLRVQRAAIRRGEAVVREGEIIVRRREVT